MSVRHMGLVLDHFDGPPHIKLAFLILADHADAEGVCWPSYGSIAARACCTRRTAITNVGTLIDAGLVEVLDAGGRKSNGKGGVNVSNLFRINDAALAALPRLAVDKSVGNPVENVRRLHRRGEAHFTSRQGVKPVSPKPSFEPSDLTVTSLDSVDNVSRLAAGLADGWSFR